MIGGRLDINNVYNDIEMHWSPSSDVSAACSPNNPPLIPDLSITLYVTSTILFKESFLYVLGGKQDYNTDSGSEGKYVN